MRKFILLSNIINTDSMFLRHCIWIKLNHCIHIKKRVDFYRKLLVSKNYLLKTFNMRKVFKIKDKWVNDQ